MKKFKTLIALVLVLSLVIAAGCKSEPSSADPTPGAETPSVTDGLTDAPEESATPDDVQASPSLTPDNTTGPSNGGTVASPTTGGSTPTATPKLTAKPTSEPTPDSEPDITAFKTNDLNGNTYTNSMFARSGLTMINVWATWCDPCIKELPDLQRVSDNYSGRMQLFGALYDSSTSGACESALTILEGLNISYPVLKCNSQLKKAMLDPYGINKMPTTLFIDSNGNVVDIVSGSHSFSEWCSIIDRLL